MFLTQFIEHLDKLMPSFFRMSINNYDLPRQIPKQDRKTKSIIKTNKNSQKYRSFKTKKSKGSQILLNHKLICIPIMCLYKILI
jgi:hypothetical protein